MAGANTWTEYVNSQELQNLFGVFNVEVPDDRSKLSFAKGFLEASKLTDFVAEIRSLANRVVLCKRLRDEDKKPGTVYVYEVGVKSMENRIVIEEKEGREIDSFSEKNEDLVKVILIESNLQNIIETKYEVYHKYKWYFPTEHVHVQHISEQFVEIAKLSGKRKIESFKHVIESIRESIPLHSIEFIVRKAVNRALSKENITQLCNDAVIAECGNSMSDAYYCRSGSTIERLKGELVKKTMKSVSNHLGSEISAEIQKHIESEIKSKFDPSLFNFNFGLASSVIVDTLSVGAIALVTALIFPMAGLFIAVVGSLMTLFSAVNVNSPLWRRDVANEIYKKVSDKKQKVLEELASDMKKRCEKTADQLTGIIRQLEDHLRRIHLIDQQKLFSEWENQNIHVEPEIVHEKMSIQDIFKDERVLERHESISRYKYGTKGGTQVFKVLLRYNDENAKREIKENISEGIHPEFTVYTERFEEIKKNLAPTVKMENSSPAVDVEERNRLSQIINEQADYVYENHSDVNGLRISNVRCVDGRLIQEPCIVIYCYDRLFVPAGEKKLPESLGGYPCDIRDNIIEFGALLGSSIGIPFSQVRGSVGFLVKSNIPLQVPVTGFLTAAHVVFNDIDSLYKEKALLSKCRHNKLCTFAQESHLIVKPAWIESAECEPIGEVVESFFGNYKPDGDDSAAFGIDAAFIKTYPPKQEVNENRRMQIVDENNLKYDGSTKVLKKGKETCETEGFLISNSASIAVRRENQPDSGYQFDNCFEIRSLNEKEDFFARGDSGSAVFVKEDGKLKPLGIAFAFSAEGSTYVCNIHHIAKMFNLSIYHEEETIETLDG